MTASELLGHARALLSSDDPVMRGRWHVAAALLARQGLELALDDYWRERRVALEDLPMRAQLICLRAYLGEEGAEEIDHAWASLSDACHYRAYDLGPGADELLAWIEAAATLAG